MKAKKLSEEKKDIIGKIERLENEESEMVNVINLSKVWKKASYEERKAVCAIMIHKIFINDSGKCEIIWNI